MPKRKRDMPFLQKHETMNLALDVGNKCCPPKSLIGKHKRAALYHKT